ncbi:MAG: hypothetical protein QY323_04540 [Patescibacteria group bacterium]|nr:MAG: hypothetical protein QY323_04540 [Patescibacteria group bacterium]
MPTAHTTARVLVIAVPMLAMAWLAYRKFWPRDPMRVVAKRLKAVGFGEWMGPDPWEKYAATHDSASFTVRKERCSACGGRTFSLRRYSEEKDEDGYPHTYVQLFGTACPHCRRLEKYGENPVPQRLRDAWMQAADLDDFLDRAA